MEAIRIDDQMILDKYRIIEELEGNSNNHLYKANNINENNDNIYILKAIPYQTHDEISFFQKEADIIELLKDDPLFVTYKDKFEHIIDVEYIDEDDQICQCKKNYMFVVMEYYLYNDLTYYNFRCNEKNIIYVLYQALNALMTLKSKEIVHHDIKLSNFLVVSVDPLKIALTDFEFAEKLINNETTFSNDGTVVFMAPEVLNEEPHDLSVDIWSLGVSGYKLASGSYPFKLISKDDITTTRQKVRRNKLTFPRIDFKDKSNDLKDLLTAMLEKDPSKRITVDQALSNKLFDEYRTHDTAEKEEINNDEGYLLESSL